jgi:isopentenyl diphosphate isomerase/L-lactate dehydrogenase-like FMN-dependent dehydrogenase
LTQQWDYYAKLKTMTDLPIIVKGIMSVKDAKLAVKHKVPAIVLSNHGGRQLDGAPSALEVALEFYKDAPEVFKEIEVYADGGIRYGTDVLKLLALGVKAVGLGRPFMYSNVFGEEGVKRAIELLKREIAVDGANLGLGDIKDIDASFVSHFWH